MADAIPVTGEPAVVDTTAETAAIPKKSRKIPELAAAAVEPAAGYMLADGVTLRRDN